MNKQKKDKFALYVSIKEQQRNCSKYFKTMVREAKEQRKTFEECACEMA